MIFTISRSSNKKISHPKVTKRIRTEEYTDISVHRTVDDEGGIRKIKFGSERYNKEYHVRTEDPPETEQDDLMWWTTNHKLDKKSKTITFTEKTVEYDVEINSIEEYVQLSRDLDDPLILYTNHNDEDNENHIIVYDSLME